jgi:diguanylate cyclase (GGDEF)-like protein/PAS domain S-box-containing protein
MLLRVAAVALIYFLVGRIGLTVPSDAYTLNIALVCSPAGIALASILRFGRPTAIGVWIGAFLVNTTIGVPWPTAAAVAFGSTLAPLVGATLMRWGDMRVNFSRQQDVLTFFIVTIVTMGIGAMIGTTALHLAGMLPQEQMRNALLYWWLGDTVGALVVAPPFLIFSGELFRRPLGASRMFEALVAVGGLLLTAALVFGGTGIVKSPQALTFIPYVLLVWIALRLGTWTAVLSVVMLAFCAILGTALGAGAFAADDSKIGITALWSYIASSVGVTLLIAALHAERNQADRALQKSEARFRDFTYSLADWFWELDHRGRFSFVAGNVEGVLGFAPDELIGKTFADLATGDDAILPVRVFEHAFAGRRPVREIEIWTTHKKDGLRCLRANGAPIIDADNNFTGFRGVFEDITSRRKADEARRLSATVFENSSEAIVITDANAKIVSVNAAFMTITGYSLEEVKGQYPSYLKSGYEAAEVYESIWAGLRGRGHWHGEAQDRKKSGELFDGLLSISAVRDERGEIASFVAIFSDISTIKKAQQELQRMAHYDALTELPNRVLLDLRLTHALERAKRSKRKSAVLVLDLDGFKTINDSLGHAAGDHLLQVLAKRLAEVVREEDTVARLGGDEFAIVLEHLRRGEDSVVVAKKLLDAVAQPVDLGNGQIALVDTSIGIALFPDDGVNAAILLRNADAAMYESKGSGPGNYRFYRPEMTLAAQSRFRLESALRQAMAQDELEVWYQPQVSLTTGAVVGAEALLRWRHPERGLVQPSEFIPLAEETNLILPLGEWVLRHACQQAKVWHDRNLGFGKMSVNVAAAQIERGNLVQLVRTILDETGLPGECLELEITEGSLLHSAENARKVTAAIREMGTPLAIDDFGTGYSSLSYLKQLPIDKLKIDQSFIRDLPGNRDDVAIARTVIALGHGLGLTVLAEAVETEAQRDFLIAEGCDEAQGFHYSRALPAVEFEAWMLAQRAGLEAELVLH